MKSLFEHFAVR